MSENHQSKVVGNQNSSQNRGFFIVIEATYTTTEISQTELLKNKLDELGYETEIYEFPELEEPSSYFVRQYLDGNYDGDVDPYTGSMMFSLERYQAGINIRKSVSAGKIVIATGYTASTMANFGIQFEHPEMRRGYYLWLENLEYQTFGIPRPDKCIVLRYNNNTSDKYLEAYDDACKLFPKDYDRMDCVRGNIQMDSGDVANYVWQTVKPLLPARKVPSSSLKTSDLVIYNISTKKFENLKDDSGKYKYFFPATLDDKSKIIYMTYMNTIIDCYNAVMRKLTSITGSQISAFNVAQDILPVACFNSTLTNKSTDNTLNESIKKHLQDTYSPVIERKTKLINHIPKNELDILPQILFENSSTSINEVSEQLEKWTYNSKSNLLIDYLMGVGDLSALNSVQYVWTLECEFSALKDLKFLGLSVVCQNLTPQYGYSIPNTIEKYGLSELYELCFDLSLELHSKLVTASYPHEAQYATLLGHRTRSYVTHTAQVIKTLQNITKRDDVSDETKAITDEMLTKISQNHPILVE